MQSELEAFTQKFELIDFDPFDSVAGFFVALRDSDLLRQAEPGEPKTAPAPLGSPDLAAMERRIIAAIIGRKPNKKPETQSPFVKRKEAIALLKTRSTLEACERAGWLKASTRQRLLVLYPR